MLAKCKHFNQNVHLRNMRLANICTQKINLHRKKLASLYPKLAALVEDEENLTLALNEEYVPMGEVWKLKEGDTVALIPPISGG